MVDTIKILDPVQGLVDYVNDIKPYHTKVIESLVEYVGHEFVNISLFENFNFGIELAYAVQSSHCEKYVAGGGETEINTQILTTTNVKFIGSPPERVYDFYGTIVYLNGVLQLEITSSTPVGDYAVTSINQILFTNPLVIDDIVEICTATQEQAFNACVAGGFGSLGYSNPETIPVLSPDPSKTIITFPAITNNSFTVLGDQRNLFDPMSSLNFKMRSFIEDQIVNVTKSNTGSPITGGSFTIMGDKSAQYGSSPLGIFIVSGSILNNNAYKITNVIVSGSPPVTILEVDGQLVPSNTVSGFVLTPDANNNFEFSITNSTFTSATSTTSEYTTVFIPGALLVTPSTPDINQKYVSLVSVKPIKYEKILSYSNVLKYYDSTIPVNLYQTPDEGDVYAAIDALSQGSPSYFDVNGDFEGSNIYVGDTFIVVGSTDNNNLYTINSIYAFGSPPITRLGVTSIHDSNPDGFVKLNIPSNVFIINGDYTDFFKQGVRIKIMTGSQLGIYTTAYSNFINGKTQIRVVEDILAGRGRLIVNSGSPLPNAFVVEGNVSSTFKPGDQFNVDLSLRNNGLYTVGSVTTTTAPVTTIIQPVEPFNNTDTTGEIHKFVSGYLKYLPTGFGETPELCEMIPETLIRIGIKEKLTFNNIGIWTYDDLITSGPTSSNWGYELPPYTIFSATMPPAPVVQANIPAAPTQDMLWFDTSNNTGSPTSPGILKQYTGGSPAVWVEVPNNKAYWIDINTDSMYYRIVYQYYDPSGSPTVGYNSNIDTSWVLEYINTPGYNDLLAGNGTREQIGTETFFAIESSTSVATTIYNFSTAGSPPLSIPLTTGSPTVPNPLMLEVYVNNVPASVNILSSTSFKILSPALRVGDLIEARVFDDIALASSTFAGVFDASASIAETLDILKGYKFHIEGTIQVGSPVINKIYIPDQATAGSPITFRVYDIFTQGSPSDNKVRIVGSEGSPNNNGIYTITNVNQEVIHDCDYVVLDVLETVIDTGGLLYCGSPETVFGGSPLIGAGKLFYREWFQYLIVNTTSAPNTITVNGDATNDIQVTDIIKIIYSYNSPSNDGLYTVSAISYAGAGSPYVAGKNTTIAVVEIITNQGNTGGWVESI